MNKRAFSFISVVCMLVLFLVACSSDSGTESDTTTKEDNSSSSETVTLRLAENQPEDYPTTIGDKEFARLVEERTDGRYKIEVYAGGQLADEKGAIEQIQLGSLDLARVNGSPLAEFNDHIGVLSLPYLFESQEEKWEVWNGEIGQEILDTFEENKMVGLAFYDNGERFFYNDKRPVKTLEDMEGIKIRVQESELAIDIVEALGASATPMSYDQVYSSIQTGVLDGAENNYPSFFTSGHYEVSQYLTLPGYQSVPEVLIASEQLWESLSEEDRAIFKEAARDSVDAQREAWDELVEESIQEIEANGNEVSEIDDITPWREAVQSVYDKHGEQYQEWLDKIQN